ncbi:aminotransferase class I/II-fold pyridoxal phosphate-dependent enzyme [Streptomyces ovatisporus]|uniref:Aminotransferase class I/II-fold pyridoxal phosphate-dependent enzyme n=1 Tax=Streptomyces ovatisporus TaxID=1128682 RepID=A0ABV9A311_9ACTN
MDEEDGWNRMQPVIGPGSVTHQMSLNETYFPPAPDVLRAVRETAAESHRTLDALASGLTARIAAHLDVPAEHVLPGPGSAALLQQLFSTLTGPGTGTVHAWPSWEAYPMLAANAASGTVPVPLRDQTHDLDAMAAAVTGRTRMVLLCNPNNPTGTAVGHEEVERFLGRLPSGVTVVIDEAYRDFADDAEAADGIALYRNDERVCVVRTFSKSYGLLSQRVGYLVGHERTLGQLRGLQLFLRVSNTAQAAAVAALDDQAEFARRCGATAEERERLRSVLLAQGWTVTPSQANFLWLPMESGVEELTQFCADHGVLVCGKPGEGVRVTIGGREADDAFAELAGKWRAETAGAPGPEVPPAHGRPPGRADATGSDAGTGST